MKEYAELFKSRFSPCVSDCRISPGLSEFVMRGDLILLGKAIEFGASTALIRKLNGHMMSAVRDIFTDAYYDMIEKMGDFQSQRVSERERSVERILKAWETMREIVPDFEQSAIERRNHDILAFARLHAHGCLFVFAIREHEFQGASRAKNFAESPVLATRSVFPQF